MTSPNRICALLAVAALMLVSAACTRPPENSNGSVAATPAASGSAPAHDYSATLDFGGLQRGYIVHLPTAYQQGQPAPLVFVLHGGGGQGASMDKLTHMNQVADQAGFIVVYPDGYQHHWADGRDTAAQKAGIDDVGFITALLDRLIAQLNVDQHRVYVTGISNGGFMTQKLACQLSDRIAAVMVDAATMPQVVADSCNPTRPISMMLIHGTADPLVPDAGGEVQDGGAGGPILSTSATLAKWAAHDGCKADVSNTPLPDTVADGTTTQRSDYSGCTAGSAVIFYNITNGGHTWPGGLQYLPQSVIGKTSRDFDASEVAISFFQSHLLKLYQLGLETA